jgi:hypothetical protein
MMAPKAHKDTRNKKQKRADALVYFHVEMDRLVDIALDDGLSKKNMKKIADKSIAGKSFFKGSVKHDPKAIHEQAMRIAKQQQTKPGEIPNVNLELVRLNRKNFVVMAVKGDK